MPLDVDLLQLKHAYLLVAMLFLTLVLVTQQTSWNHFIVAITLAGHAYLAYKFKTLNYLKRMCSISTQTGGELIYSLVPTPQTRTQVRNDTVQYPRQAIRNIEQTQVAPRNFGDRRNTLREMMPYESRSKSSLYPESSLMWRHLQQRNDDAFDKNNDLLSDIQTLRYLHTDTINDEKIPQRQYIQSIGRLVGYLSMWIQQLLTAHQHNIKQLNLITSNYFGLQLCLTDAMVNELSKPQSISVDEVMSAAACLRTMGCLKWKWTKHITIPEQVDVLAEFSRLAVERMTLDNFLTPGEQVHNWREKCVNRLVTLAADLEPARYAGNFTRELPLKNVTDKQLFFSFFRSTIDRLMAQNTSKASPLRVRRQETCKSINDGLIYFLSQLRDSGLDHTDISYQNKIYHCQPGDNNMLSAFYFYLYVIKVNLSNLLVDQTQLQKIVRIVVI